MFEDEEELQDVQFDSGEDEGLDLNAPKVQIKEDEEKPKKVLTEEEQKARKKKIKIGAISGCGLVVLIVVIIFIVTRPDVVERVLPFDVTEKTVASMDEYVKENKWTVEKLAKNDELWGIVTTGTSLKKEPSNGGTLSGTIEKGTKLHILGTVYFGEEEQDWVYVIYKGEFGYVNIENLELIDPYSARIDSVVSTEEESDEEIVDYDALSEKEKELVNKAYEKKLNNVTTISNHIQAYQFFNTYIGDYKSTYESVLNGEIELSVVEDGSVIDLYAGYTPEKYAILVDIYDNFTRDYSAYKNTTEETLKSTLDGYVSKFIATFGALPNEEEYYAANVFYEDPNVDYSSYEDTPEEYIEDYPEDYIPEENIEE